MKSIRLIPMIGILIAVIGAWLGGEDYDVGKTVFQLGFMICAISVLVGSFLSIRAYRASIKKNKRP